MKAVGGRNVVGHAVRGMSAVRGTTPTSDERWKRSMQAVLAAYAAKAATPAASRGA